MKKFFRLAVGLLLSVALFSCSKDDDESEKNGQSVDALTYEYDALIINQGNYSESNGSVSLWKNNQVVNQVYENANGGEKLASIIESAVDCGTSWALLCNNADKIEWIDKATFQSVGVLTGVATPRYGVVKDGYLYVTSVTDWYGSDGKVYKINLISKKIEVTIPVKGQPEGIIEDNGSLYVATAWAYNSTTYSNDSTGVAIVSESDNTVTYCGDATAAGAVSRHIAKAANGNIYLSVSSYYEGNKGLYQLSDNDGVKTLTNHIALEGLNYAGHIYIVDNTVYYLTTDNQYGGAGAADENNSVVAYNLENTTSTKVATGNGFYGFGVNPKTLEIYTANSEGFVTNSIFYLYKDGSAVETGEQLAGVGACRFYFPN